MQIPPRPEWSETEKWVWQQVCRKETADFNRRDGDLDPKGSDGWSERRLISPEFLEDILIHDPFRSALDRKGVHIVGAWIKEPIDLENTRLVHELRLEKSRFDAGLKLSELESTENVSFAGSSFASLVEINFAKVGGQFSMTAAKCMDKLSMNSISVGGHLLLRNGAEFTEVDLDSARVGGQLNMDAAKFTGKLNMEGIVVGSNIFIRDGAELTEVNLASSKVDGQIKIASAKITKILNMNSSEVGRHIFIGNGAELKEVNLAGVQVYGGFEISSARFTGKVNMDGLSVRGNLLIKDKTNFDELILRGAKVEGQVSILSSKFTGKLNMNNLRASNLFMKEKSEFVEVNLVSAKVDGQINMTTSKFTRHLNMNSLIGTGSLLMSGSEFAEVDLGSVKIDSQVNMTSAKFSDRLNMNNLQANDLLMRETVSVEINLGSAKIDGQIDMSSSKIRGNLNMNSLVVGSNLFIRDQAEFSEVDLGSAKVGGQIDIAASKFRGQLKMGSLLVGSHLILREGVECDRLISITFGNIDGNLDISHTHFPELDLTGVHVQGELRIDLSHAKSKRIETSHLILRNAKVGALQDGGEDSWPNEPNTLDLSGFIYTRLGGFDPGENISIIESRKKEWFIQWLKKDRFFSPQPYHQLASVLHESGHTDKATEILYAGKERERHHAKGLNRFWLSLLKSMIGYGYGYRYFYSLYWVVPITLLGAVIFGCTEKGQPLSLGRAFAFSLDLLLPFIELDSEHSTWLSALNDYPRYYFYVHKVFGFILGSFVVAGLSGITKK